MSPRRSLPLALALLLFVVGICAGLWQPVRAAPGPVPDPVPLASGEDCAQEKSCFPRCQCQHKVCRIGCFEKFKDADGKVDPGKWEPCIDACVKSYQVCQKRC